MTRRFPLLMLALVALPLLAALGVRGLNEPDEGRYVEMAREMLVTGDYLVPRIKGTPHYAKPPLTMWCIAASLKLFGFRTLAARLPSALAAVWCLVVVLRLGRRLAGETAGLVSAAVLAAMLGFFAPSQLVTTDMLLCAAATSALAAFWTWRDGGRRRWLVVFWAAQGVGFLVKGPVILLVVLATVGGFAGLSRSWRRTLGGLGAWWGLPLVALIGLPWFVILVSRDGELLRFFLGQEVVGRVVSGRGRGKPFHHLLLVLPLLLWPWTGLVAAAVVRRARAVWRGEDREGALLLAWIVLPLIGFSASASKLWTYLLPLMPAAALLAGTTWARHEAPRAARVATWSLLAPLAWLSVLARTQGRRWAAWVAAALVVLLGAAALVPRFELELGHNASFRALVRALPAEPWTGARIHRGLGVAVAAPRYEGGGVRLATYRFRFLSAGFYLLRGRPEFIPNYGGSTRWELPSRARGERLPTRDDLVALLASDEPVLVLTKQRFVGELEEALGFPLRQVAAVGDGRGRVVALKNR